MCHAGKDEGWDSLTCGRLLEMAEDVQARIKEGKEKKGGGLQFEKLTHGFWRRYMRREILRAGGERERKKKRNKNGDERAHHIVDPRETYRRLPKKKATTLTSYPPFSPAVLCCFCFFSRTDVVRQA